MTATVYTSTFIQPFLFPVCCLKFFQILFQHILPYLILCHFLGLHIVQLQFMGHYVIGGRKGLDYFSTRPHTNIPNALAHIVLNFPWNTHAEHCVPGFILRWDREKHSWSRWDVSGRCQTHILYLHTQFFPQVLGQHSVILWISFPLNNWFLLFYIV